MRIFSSSSSVPRFSLKIEDDDKDEDEDERTEHLLALFAAARTAWFCPQEQRIIEIFGASGGFFVCKQGT
jgi:hypothetical protein